ncbi:GlyGly-CTERM sorting domain-containing protein [Halogeometricum sp. S1BR25-6]|uniref:GlyGly-CTERM sorting domain-containing protein n=1 Tax=Halogeometricum salsisoli TaxID=2950536 RepID=A0ABU2GKR7_9EURY|nr:GlyGly-CTERM sorting domain-containing protein [Halogeometricum sp. S1BR25-6]MDS0301409.1 GlyGly-CTERM sorting domain-containing protein [Halogeometricum sp. S1BR25-6]
MNTIAVAHAAVVDTSLPIVLGVGTVGGLSLLVMGVFAYRRRPTVSYLLLTLAIAALVGRVGVGGLAFGGLIDGSIHHLVEHGLDVVTLLAVIGAIYLARRNHGNRNT